VLKETSRISVAPQDHTNLLIEGKKAADRGDTIDVTKWIQEQIAERLFADNRKIEKLIEIAATKGVEAALEHLDGTPQEDHEVHRAR
jgi:hypothetical protein